ncbi:MAG: PadR family transcriptional regulator, partial [Alphaproteobacteria bacterium]
MDVRTLCLGVLSEGGASGYEIKKKLEQTYRHFFQASFGSIYPALSRMTEDG